MTGHRQDNYQNPEVDVRTRPNFEARRNALMRLSSANYAKTLIFGKLVSWLSSDMTWH